MQLHEIETSINSTELQESFHKDLEFGTGGLRGIIGLGTNRINKFTIRKATQGIANFINQSVNNKFKSVVIAYDTRNYSREFALETALVFAANDVKVFLFSEVTPTPILSYGVRQLNADIGIVITASHNPKEYNGYKVYNNTGGQITLDMANKLEFEIGKVHIFDDVKTISKELAIAQGNLIIIPNDIYNSYYDRVLTNSFNHEKNLDLNIVYTPIHGSGLIPIKKLLEVKKYKLKIVEEQATFDGNFPTVKYPNSEEPTALALAVNLAIEVDADIVLGTDPDADRVGIAVKHQGEYQYLTGNEIGILLLNEILKTKNITSNDFIIKTIVTSDLGKVIALKKGASVVETLTGFKFIGEQINELESRGQRFLFGYEESYGYLKDTFVRDKDAVMSSILICDIAAIYKKQSKTLIDVLNSIYREYGYYFSALETISFTGVNGMKKMSEIIHSVKYKRNAINDLNIFSKLQYIEDYNTSEKHDIISDTYYKLVLPKSNVIKFIYDDSSWIVIRPSGTEPKLKIYYQAVSKIKEDAELLLDKLKSGIKKLLSN